MVTTHKLLAATAILLGATACVDADGDVLTSLGAAADGSVSAPDATGTGTPDAAPPDPCSDLRCPTPTPGRFSLCGYVIDAETSRPITDIDSLPLVEIYDLSGFSRLSTDPVAAVFADECGWYQADGLSAIIESVVITIGDYDHGPYRRTVGIANTTAGSPAIANAWAVRNETEQAWTAAADLSLGDFNSRGALIAIFVDTAMPPVTGPLQGTPVTGVKLTTEGLLSVEEEHYFADTEPLTRSVPASGLVDTGINGAVIMPNAVLPNTFSGERTGCTFDSTVGLGGPTLLHVQEIRGTCQ